MIKIIEIGKINYQGQGYINPFTIMIETKRRGGETQIDEKGNRHKTPLYNEVYVWGDVWNAPMNDLVFSAELNKETFGKYIKHFTPKQKELFFNFLKVAGKCIAVDSSALSFLDGCKDCV